jgi:hypothetical protein
MSHAAFAAARANFHNQSIVDHLPGDASAASDRPQQIAAPAGYDGNCRHSFHCFIFSKMLSEPKRERPGGFSLGILQIET